MALRIRTTIQGEHKFLDIYQDEPVSLNLSFAELEDITKKNSAFSQSFKLPGTKNNNDIFNYYYDINSIPTNFNPNNKFETILSWDGYEILRGNIRLDTVIVDKDEIIYQVTFYNQVGDLSANIGDKFLRDLDLSDLSHPYNDEVITYSQLDPNLFPLTGTTNYSYQNGKVFWGLYNIGYEYISANTVNVITSPLVQFTPSSGGTYTPSYGYFDFTGTPVNDFYFKPSIQVKELYTQICNEAGYKVKSNFFDTSYLQRYYMPLKFLDETIYEQNAKQPCFAYTNSVINPNGGITAFTNPLSAQTCNNVPFSATTSGFTIPSQYSGLYTFKLTFTISGTSTDECGLEAVNNGPGDFVFQYVDSNGVNQTYTIPSVDVGLLFTIPGACCPSPISGNGSVYPAGDGTYNLFFWDGISAPVILNSGTAICKGQVVNLEAVRTLNITGTSNVHLFFTGQQVRIIDIKFEITSAPRFLISGDTINYALEFPTNDYKQIDFITSINRYFNLVVVPSPDDPGEIIVEPIIDYIGKGQLLDWTTKIDHLQPIQIQPTTSLINGTLEYSFRLDQDYANQNYKSASNRIFGSEKKKLGLDFKDNVTKFDYMFSSPMDITILPAIENMLTLSSFSKINQKDEGGKAIQTFVPFKILPRLVFRGLTIPQDNYGYIGDTATTITYQNWYLKAIGTTYPQTRFQEINRFTTYPFNYNGFSHYTNWRGEDTTTITPPEYTFVAEDLYDIYYNDYIEDLISPENKLYSAKIYLYPNEIKALKFNEKILVNNAYFRINKISNYNLLEPSICDIELVKLTKDYRPHRVLYYDLISCDPLFENLYSSSDFNYNLYAYIGNYVKVYDDNLNYLGCFNVQLGTYNISNQYQHYYISSGYSENFVSVYDNCDCTGRTAFDIVQEVPPVTPTPTPTINITPSVTPSFTPTNTTTPTPSVTVGLTPTATQTQTPTPSQCSLDFSVGYICNEESPDSTVIASGFTCGSGQYDINQFLYLSQSGATNGVYTQVNSPAVYYFSTANNTWWICVKDRNNPTNIVCKSITTNCP